MDRIILDTNVLSEAMSEKPDANVMRWFESLPWSSVYTTSITQAEILYGIELMERGRKRTRLAALAEHFFDEKLAERVLPFEKRDAVFFTEITSRRRKAGLTITFPDGQIAAITARLQVPLATRNTPDFADCGLTLINPWSVYEGNP